MRSAYKLAEEHSERTARAMLDGPAHQHGRRVLAQLVRNALHRLVLLLPNGASLCSVYFYARLVSHVYQPVPAMPSCFSNSAMAG